MVIEPPYYPIVYVRGFAPTSAAREGTFDDAYYGFAETSVEKRATPPRDDGKPRYRVDVFEGQLVRFLKEYDYVDAWNNGLMRGIVNPQQVDNPLRPNPTRLTKTTITITMQPRPRQGTGHPRNRTPRVY